MPISPFRAAALLIAALALAGRAEACSVREGYRTPTNFELVQKAELIVVGRVVPAAPADRPAGASEIDFLGFEPVKAIKGELPPERLRIAGYFRLPTKGTTVEPMPTPLTTSHFSAGMGACIRLLYPQNGLVLAMFAKGPQGWTQLTDPFARAIEDVEDADGLWVRTAARYAALQQRAPGEALRAAAIAERDALLGKTGEMEPQAVADDLQAWLDATGSGGSGPARAPKGPRWRQFDTPGESMAAIGNGNKDMQLVGCRRDGTAVLLQATVAGPQSRLALRIGDRLFDAAGAAPSVSREIGGSARLLPFTPELRAALAGSAGPVSVTVDGRDMASGPAGDLFQKLGLRCRALLSR